MARTAPDQFTLTTASGWNANTRLLALSAPGGANSVATQFSFGAASTGNATQQVHPEGTAVTVAIPGAPATWSGIGWAGTVLNADPVTTDTTAITVSFVTAASGWTTTPTVTWTVILYLGEPNGGAMVEIGRATSAALAPGGTVTMTVTPGATHATSATSPRICVELWGAVGIGVGGIGTNLITVATGGSTGRLTTGGAFTVQAARGITATAVGAASVARHTVAFRPVTTTAVGVSSFARTLTLGRIVAPTAVGVVSMSKQVGLPVTVTAVGKASIVKAITKSITAIAVGVAAVTRRLILFRAITTTAVGLSSFARALIFGRQIVTASVGVVKIRADVPIERLTGSGGTTIISPIFVYEDG